MMTLLMGQTGISPGDLQQLMKAQQVHVIDVNSRQSWIKAHVPGARNLDPEGFSAADLPPDRNASLVFYCSNPMCRKAPGAARRAKKMGFENVRVMSAGITGWLDRHLPTESGA